MAKQSLNFFEQHLEKISVGAAAALFVWVIYAFVVNSPNKIELQGGDPVTPAEIDERVKATADRALQGWRNADPVDTASEMTDYPDQQRKSAANPLTWPGSTLTAELRRAISFGPPVPQVSGPGEPGKVVLAHVVAPDKPQALGERISALFAPRSVAVNDSLSDIEWDRVDQDGPEARSYITVAARFDVKKQKQVYLEHNYQTTRMSVLASKIELQRQTRLSNGHWGDWEDVQLYNENFMPPAPVLQLIEDNKGGWSILADRRNELRVWLDLLIEHNAKLVRPQLPEAWYGKEWRPPLLEKLAELYPDEFKFTPPKAPTTGRRRTLSPNKQARLDLVTVDDLQKEGKLDEALVLVESLLRRRGVSGSVTRDAEARLDEIEDALKARRKAEGLRGDQEDDEEEVELVEHVFLAHDMNARQGETYRYRMKVQAYNQYATIIDRLKDRNEATKVFLEGEWSVPGDPIRMPALQRVFLSSTKIKDDIKEARFEVYNWVQGQWVDFQFRTKVGEEIGSEKRVPVGKAKQRVDFGTGLVLLAINPNRSYVPLKKQRDGSFEAAAPELSAAALCLDADGNLLERIAAIDRRNEDKAAIEDEMSAAKRAQRRRRTVQSGRGSSGRGGSGGGGGGIP